MDVMRKTATSQRSEIQLPLASIKEALYDYGKLYKGIGNYMSYSPETIDEAIDFMEYTASQNIDIRFRGSGHTFNGVTLPTEDEILVFTSGLDHYRFEADGSLTVGAGAILWDVRDLARDYGLDLMVYNGGWAGPSVGGFINAGGFGKGNLSSFNGGLWESINSIKLIDAAGNLRTITREDEVFPWLFGSYGQLGFIVEVNMKLVKGTPFSFTRNSQNNRKKRYPSGLVGRVPKRQKDDPNENKMAPVPGDPDILFWYSMMIAPEEEEQAWEDISEWVDAYADIIKPQGGWHGPMQNGQHIGYHYFIKHVNFHPPLIYAKEEDFLMIGVMSKLNVSQKENVSRIFEVERAFIEMADKRKYRLYLQAENFGRNIDFQRYYGIDVFTQFLSYKNELDPLHRINRHVFFDRN